jgi:RNA polymerase sigma-70 factor, ECF subfamily
MEEKFLINGILTHNKIVFDFVFHYYYSGLCAYCERITGSRQTAEDIVQDLFIYLWIKHDQINITFSLKNYLFTSVKNRALDFIKHEKVKIRKLNSLDPSDKNSVDNLSSFWLAESELLEIIEKGLEKLTPRCREIFRLSRFEELKNQDIAEKLGISKRTVELQISNALKILRVELKPYLPVFLLMYLLR